MVKGKKGVQDLLEDLAGEVCKVLFPLRIGLYEGHGVTVSICTLSSVDLLVEISNGNLMKRLAIAGCLYSENKGIDQIIGYCLTHDGLKYIVLCGKDTLGHFPGNALINLAKNGVDSWGRILGSVSPRPFVSLPLQDVMKFRQQITVIDMRNCFDIEKISKTVSLLDR